MKLTANRAQMVGCLERILSSFDFREVLPRYEHLLIEAENRSVTFSMTDLKLWVTLSLEATITEAGAVQVPARMFSEVLSRRHSDEITLTVSAPTMRLRIQDPDYEMLELSGLAADSFQAAPQVAEIAAEFRVPRLPLELAIGRVGRVAESAEQRAAASSVVMWCDRTGITLAAADARRLARDRIDLATPPISAPDSLEILLPADTFLRATRAWTGDEVVLGFGEDMRAMVLQFSGGTQYLRLVDSPVPVYPDTSMDSDDTWGVVSRDVLCDRLETFIVLATRGGLGAHWSSTGKSIRISALGEEIAEADASVPVRDGDLQMDLVLDPISLLPCLKAIPSEALRIGVRNGGRAMTVRPAAESHLCFLFAGSRTQQTS